MYTSVQYYWVAELSDSGSTLTDELKQGSSSCSRPSHKTWQHRNVAYLPIAPVLPWFPKNWSDHFLFFAVFKANHWNMRTISISSYTTAWIRHRAVYKLPRFGLPYSCASAVKKLPRFGLLTTSCCSFHTNSELACARKHTPYVFAGTWLSLVLLGDSWGS